MNAYELANEIENFYKHHNQPYLLIQLQSILRQQADRIAELEKQLSGYQTAAKHYREKSEKQNEPVAWLIQAKTWHEFSFDKPAYDYSENESIEIEPLYTTLQTKLLNDEERYELLEKYQGIELCRAIEAKVRGEK